MLLSGEGWWEHGKAQCSVTDGTGCLGTFHFERCL